MPTIRIGTRASRLARWQADWTAQQLRNLGAQVEIILITTDGDQLTGSIQNSPERGLFTKRIQQALLAKQIDLAVHSLKDLPTEPISGLSLAAVPPRENPSDVLISRTGQTLADLPSHSKIGTGSWRRQSQLLHHRADISVADIRGNVDTRLNKLRAGDYDAIVLAFAGLERLGFADQITQILDYDIILPAVGQGALGLETRSEDAATRDIVSRLNDANAMAAVTAERSLLLTIGGGCLAPVGALGSIADDKLSLRACVLTHDGERRVDSTGTDSLENAADLGASVARHLVEQGAQELISHSRQESPQ